MWFVYLLCGLMLLVFVAVGWMLFSIKNVKVMTTGVVHDLTDRMSNKKILGWSMNKAGDIDTLIGTGNGIHLGDTLIVQVDGARCEKVVLMTMYSPLPDDSFTLKVMDL